MNYALMQSYAKDILERETGKNQPIGDTEIQQVINDAHTEFVARTNILTGKTQIIKELDVESYG